MRNLLECPITPDEVIDYLKMQVIIEDTVAEMANFSSIDPMCAKAALAVVQAASTVVQNDIGSTAAHLLSNAFQSQDIPAREMA